MSRVAKMPVTVPAGVDVTMNEQHISVKGAGGQLSIANNALVKVVRQGESMTFEAANESREANAMSGTLRQLVNQSILHRLLAYLKLECTHIRPVNNFMEQQVSSTTV